MLLVDATNAFNKVNRHVFLHKVKVICPAVSTYVNNYCSLPSRLFVIGGAEIASEEGTSQGDPQHWQRAQPLMLLELTEKFPNKQKRK